MLLKFPLAFGATILLTTVAADRDLLFFANTCATTCDDNSGNFLMYRTSADGATCRTRCSAGMWTFFLRLLGWGCGDCPDMIMQGIDHAEGFFCDEASEDLITLNRDPANLDYPRYQVHPVLADKCFLRLTPDEPVLKNRAVSAFEPLEFHAANPQHSFSAVIDYRAYGNKGQDGSGMTFVIQKDARDAKALGEDDNGLGVYGHDYTNSFHNAQIRPALVVELRSCTYLNDLPLYYQCKGEN